MRVPRRERVVLAAGLVSAAALAWAALAPWGDAELAGRVELERRVGRAVDLVRLGWDRLLRGGQPPVPPLGDTLEWRPEDLTSPVWPEPIDRNPLGTERVAFDVLLAQAEEQEDPSAALAQVEQALEEHPGAERRPEGVLRAIQLAVEVGDRQALARNRERGRELAWDAARVDTAYRILFALAAAPLLDRSQRVREQGELAAAWVRGELALPAPDDHWTRAGAAGWRYHPGPRLELVAERLEALAPDHAPAVSTAADCRGRRARSLARALDPDLDPGIDGLPSPPTDGRWHPTPIAADLLLVRRDPDGLLHGAWVDPRELIETLARTVELGVDLALAPADAAASAGAQPGEPPAGEPVGAPIELEAGAGGALTVALRHQNPRALVRAEAGRIRSLRLAFGALALLSALASGVTHRALRRERRLAELKSSFVAGVSHDLRTPLASILLMAENLETGRVAGESARQRYFGAIRREARRLARLVDDVLDFSRIERGQRPRLYPETLDLPRFVEELATEAGERVEQAGGGGGGAKLRFERGELPPTARLDAEAVRRSTANLVDNALRHSGSTEVTLVARVEDGHFLVLEVVDRGRGVPPARREEIFRPFARLEGPGAGGGTGLGLAIVREVARAHGGDATVDAGPGGVGARFRLRLDLGREVG